MDRGWVQFIMRQITPPSLFPIHRATTHSRAMKDLSRETFGLLETLFVVCSLKAEVQVIHLCKKGQALFKPIPNVGHNLKIRSALFKLRLYPRMHKEL